MTPERQAELRADDNLDIADLPREDKLNWIQRALSAVPELLDAVDELREALRQSEELREAVITASVESALERAALERAALEQRLELYGAVVSASRTFLEDPSSVNALFALAEAVESCPVLE